MRKLKIIFLGIFVLIGSLFVLTNKRSLSAEESPSQEVMIEASNSIGDMGFYNHGVVITGSFFDVMGDYIILTDQGTLSIPLNDNITLTKVMVTLSSVNTGMIYNNDVAYPCDELVITIDSIINNNGDVMYDIGTGTNLSIMSIEYFYTSIGGMVTLNAIEPVDYVGDIENVDDTFYPTMNDFYEYIPLEEMEDYVFSGYKVVDKKGMYEYPPTTEIMNDTTIYLMWVKTYEKEISFTESDIIGNEYYNSGVVLYTDSVMHASENMLLPPDGRIQQENYVGTIKSLTINFVDEIPGGVTIHLIGNSPSEIIYLEEGITSYTANITDEMFNSFILMYFSASVDTEGNPLLDLDDEQIINTANLEISSIDIMYLATNGTVMIDNNLPEGEEVNAIYLQEDYLTSSYYYLLVNPSLEGYSFDGYYYMNAAGDKMDFRRYLNYSGMDLMLYARWSEVGDRTVMFTGDDTAVDDVIMKSGTELNLVDAYLMNSEIVVDNNGYISFDSDFNISKVVVEIDMLSDEQLKIGFPSYYPTQYIPNEIGMYTFTSLDVHSNSFSISLSSDMKEASGYIKSVKVYFNNDDTTYDIISSKPDGAMGEVMNLPSVVYNYFSLYDTIPTLEGYRFMGYVTTENDYSTLLKTRRNEEFSVTLYPYFSMINEMSMEMNGTNMMQNNRINGLLMESKNLQYQGSKLILSNSVITLIEPLTGVISSVVIDVGTTSTETILISLHKNLFVDNELIVVTPDEEGLITIENFYGENIGFSIIYKSDIPLEINSIKVNFMNQGSIITIMENKPEGVTANVTGIPLGKLIVQKDMERFYESVDTLPRLEGYKFDTYYIKDENGELVTFDGPIGGDITIYLGWIKDGDYSKSNFTSKNYYNNYLYNYRTGLELSNIDVENNLIVMNSESIISVDNYNTPKIDQVSFLFNETSSGTLTFTFEDDGVYDIVDNIFTDQTELTIVIPDCDGFMIEYMGENETDMLYIKKISLDRMYVGTMFTFNPNKPVQSMGSVSDMQHACKIYEVDEFDYLSIPTLDGYVFGGYYVMIDDIEVFLNEDFEFVESSYMAYAKWTAEIPMNETVIMFNVADNMATFDGQSIELMNVTVSASGLMMNSDSYIIIGDNICNNGLYKIVIKMNKPGYNYIDYVITGDMFMEFGESKSKGMIEILLNGCNQIKISNESDTIIFITSISLYFVQL